MLMMKMKMMSKKQTQNYSLCLKSERGQEYSENLDTATARITDFGHSSNMNRLCSDLKM